MPEESHIGTYICLVVTPRGKKTRVVCGKACSFSLLKSVGHEAGVWGRHISCLQLQGKEWHAYCLSFPRCRHLVNDLKILMPHSRTGIICRFSCQFLTFSLGGMQNICDPMPNQVFLVFDCTEACKVCTVHLVILSYTVTYLPDSLCAYESAKEPDTSQ